MNFTRTDIERIDWSKSDGLVPAIVQHASSGSVLMLGYMNREALAATLARRSRGVLQPLETAAVGK